jgi:hypothetical protein
MCSEVNSCRKGRKDPSQFHSTTRADLDRRVAYPLPKSELFWAIQRRQAVPDHMLTNRHNSYLLLILNPQRRRLGVRSFASRAQHVGAPETFHTNPPRVSLGGRKRVPRKCVRLTGVVEGPATSGEKMRRIFTAASPDRQNYRSDRHRE